MSRPEALILFAHGARDPRWAEPLHALQASIRSRAPDVPVAQAFLELMQPSLAQTVDELVAQGHTRIAVLPVFWSAGGHVVRDLPAMLDDAMARHPGLSLRVLPVLSELPGVLDAVAAAALSDSLSGADPRALFHPPSGDMP